jgi:membrane protease YdiL (CAAX protease family)
MQQSSPPFKFIIHLCAHLPYLLIHMFNRYWRSYPWILQLILFFLMIFTLMSFVTFLVLAIVPKLSGASLTDIINLSPKSPASTARVALIVQVFSQIGTFVIPAILFAIFTHPRIREYLGLRPPGKRIHWLLVTGIIVGLVPVLVWGENWMAQHIHLGKAADQTQEQNNNITSAFLQLPGGGNFLLLLAALALLPAMGEELIFRGVLLRLLHRGFKRLASPPVADGYIPSLDPNRAMVVPVVLSGLIFAVFHSSPYGFTFIFIAGCVLALVYFLTGSLLCSMWAHLLNNGIQITAVYLTRGNEAANKMAQGENLPILFPIIGLVLFALCFYALVKNQTPLKPDWSDDFTPAELEQEKQP